MRRNLICTYGVLCYVVFLATFLYAVGFLGNFWVPRSIDSGVENSVGAALVVNALLLALFAVQHSVMARPTFKRWWTKLIPEPAERPTYVLFSSLALIVLFWLWQPMSGTIWDVEQPIAGALIYGLFGAGWVLVLVATFLINHFDLFGLRQVWLHFKGKPYTALQFVTPGLYRIVRHPLYVGWLTVFWSTPTMTIGRLVFAVGCTGYILAAIQLEERNLLQFLGDDYADYQRRTPMLIPRIPRRGSNAEDVSPTKSDAI